MKLPNSKAQGPDKITTGKLKNFPKKIRIQIYYILKTCIQTSYFPNSWKLAKIHPIPKPGKPNTKIHNYRPFKEQIIHSHLLTHLNNNNIIIPQQYGSHENHSYTAATKSHRVRNNGKQQKQDHTVNLAENGESVRHCLARSVQTQ